MVYLDNAATTRISNKVADEMAPYIYGDKYGNAGAIYKLGRNIAKDIDKARSRVATLFGANPENIVFTSGGSEGNNMVFNGIAETLLKSGKTTMVISDVEHDSVRRAANSVKDRFGLEIEILPVTCDGTVDLKVLQELLENPLVGFVSVMYVNNETGSVNPIASIGKMCHDKGILFMTDCVQAAGCNPIDVDTIMCDFATISSHKIHGPKGVGAVYIRNKETIVPLIYGGASQEFGLRGGTENVAGIIGFGKACEIAKNTFSDTSTSVSLLRNLFYSTLLLELTNSNIRDIMSVNGSMNGTRGKILNLRFNNIDGETLLMLMDSKDIFISAGSACRSHESQPSHVLLAMGLTSDEARDSVRISFSTMNSVEEVKYAAETLAHCVYELNNIKTLKCECDMV